MTSHKLFLAVFVALLMIIPVSATYAGDNPLTTVFHEELNGGHIFSTGNSTYSGAMKPGDQYNVSYEINLPKNSTIRYQRLYIYWAWSKLDQKAIYPVISVARADMQTRPNMTGRYVDSKGFVSKNDFFSGMDSYEIQDLLPGNNSFNIVLKNTATDNRTFVVQGIGILAIYENPESTDAIYWVKEGADLLYSNYGITPEMAQSRIDFEGTIDRSELSSAEILLVAPSGGYTRENIPEINRLFVNRESETSMPSFFESILSAIFPGSNGKEWTNIFDSDETKQIGIDRRDVLPYLRSENNFAVVQDEKDYLVLTNAILRAERR